MLQMDRCCCSPLFKRVVVKLSSTVVKPGTLVIGQSAPGSVVVPPESARFPALVGIVVPCQVLFDPLFHRLLSVPCLQELTTFRGLVVLRDEADHLEAPLL